MGDGRTPRYICATEDCHSAAVVVVDRPYCGFCAGDMIVGQRREMFRVKQVLQRTVQALDNVQEFIYECDRCDGHVLEVAKHRSEIQEILDE